MLEAVVVLDKLPHKLRGRHPNQFLNISTLCQFSPAQARRRPVNHDLEAFLPRSGNGREFHGVKCSEVFRIDGPVDCSVQTVWKNMGGSALSSGTDLSADASESCLDQQSPVSASERLANLEDAVRSIILGIGEDVSREGLRDTPKVNSVRTSIAGFPAHCRLVPSYESIDEYFAASGEGLAGCILGLQTDGKEVSVAYLVASAYVPWKCHVVRFFLSKRNSN